MKALTYEQAHPLSNFAIELREVPLPTVKDNDLLIRVKAFAVNPGDTLIRRSRSAAPGGRVILGWELSGIVEKTGPAVIGFQPGDQVFAAGDTSRDGNYAEYVAVDYRVVGRKPVNLSFTEAAAIPMTFQTAWGALMRDGNHLPAGVNTVLIVGGAGGVGSMAIQLLKAKTDVTVIATASRPESKRWVEEMGADLVIDHHQDMAAQLQPYGITKVDLVFAARHSESHLAAIARLLKPYGHLSLIDARGNLNVSGLMPLSASIHLETVFARIINNEQPELHGAVLDELATLVEAGKVKSTLNKTLSGLTAADIHSAHKLIEAESTIGKIVISLGNT
ncbi:MAG: zinc-binding alcohol dehydrogenase family protein [Cytophagales bacterium]|nr:zinc-binding alcohol dehydrogenase family protein [Cytophagales bacterium]